MSWVRYYIVKGLAFFKSVFVCKKQSVCLLLAAVFLAFQPKIAVALNESNVSENDTYQINYRPVKLSLREKKKSVIGTKSELMRLIMVPFLVDNIYKGDAINNDITEFLAEVYPETDEKTLRRFADAVRFFVRQKRKYDYVVTTLRHRVKALAILPQDAPLVAEDGEYARLDAQYRKSSDAKNYRVSYHPYKYLEYDPGELGEPVRRRDKNYAGKADNLDELVLALLEFDVPAFIRAWRRLPRQTDGSDEVWQNLGEGVRGRALLSVSKPGSEESINAGIEIFLPKGFYINGDFLNERTKPRFYLSEDKKDELNIKSYELFSPMADGIEQGTSTARILTGKVLFPLSLKRRKTDEKMRLSGSFSFELCKEGGECRRVLLRHELTLPVSERYEVSNFYNYITQAFLHLPKNKAKHAELTEVSFDAEKNTLSVRFKTNKPFSNVAVMAEDAEGGAYLHPRYKISSDEVKVVYDVNGKIPQEIAVSAVFDDEEALRTTAKVTEKALRPNIASPVKTAFIEEAAYFNQAKCAAQKFEAQLPFSAGGFFSLGMLICFMPGILYVMLRLARYIFERGKGFIIYCRFLAGTALSFAALKLAFDGQGGGAPYASGGLLAGAFMVVLSFMAEAAEVVDFRLFRPFRRFLKSGLLMGMFVPVIAVLVPFDGVFKAFNAYFDASAAESFKIGFWLWLGIAVLAFGVLLFANKLAEYAAGLKHFNLIYKALLLLFWLWIAAAFRGVFGVVVLGGAAVLVLMLWQVYPKALIETLGHTRNKARKQALFYQVQQHCLLVVVVIFVLTTAALALLPVKGSRLLPVSLGQRIEQRLAANGVVLLQVTAPYSLKALYNRMLLSKYSKTDGFEIINIDAQVQEKEVLAAFSCFNVNTVPLNVLFTKRHPEGLVLPENLRNVDWRLATKNYY